jgi:protein-tyrosine-phosphatase
MGAATLAAACTARGLPVEVSSAGFLFDGRPASDDTRKVMRGRGLDVEAHRSRIVGADVLDGIDLVLDHDPPAPVHTFKAFAALASAMAVDAPERLASFGGDLRQFVRAVDATRLPGALLGDGRPDEVDDPHGRSVRVHRKAAEEIAAAADAIAAALGTVRGAP